MPDLAIMPIVEGHGDRSAVPLLLRRIMSELCTKRFPNVLTPIRKHRHRLIGEGGIEGPELQKSIELAALKLEDQPCSKLILVLIDADEDCPATVGPLIQTVASRVTAVPTVAVLANVEYETWFVGGAQALDPSEISIGPGGIPARPEAERHGKGWIKSRRPNAIYSETVDQPILTAKMDLLGCRRRCPSFDKLCRALCP